MTDEVKDLPEWVPHVFQEGSRRHVLSYSGEYDALGIMRAGRRCSEANCIINMPAAIRQLGETQ